MLEEVCVLAMSNTRSGICIAGVNSNGKWVRPIKRGGRFWNKSDLTFNNQLLKLGNTISFEGDYYNDGSSNIHTEDFVTDRIILINTEDIIFQGDYDSITIPYSEVSLLCEETLYKSLALIQLEEILVFKNDYGKIRCSLIKSELANTRTYSGDYAFNDYEYKPTVSSVLTTKRTRYVSIGLAKPFKRNPDDEEICYPQIVGVIE